MSGINEFNKEERVVWKQMLKGYEDGLALSSKVSVDTPGNARSERTNDKDWYPQPYIVQSGEGRDQTDGFKAVEQLSVPTSISFDLPITWTMTASELRDGLQNNRIAAAATRKAASDINVKVTDVMSNQGSLVVPVSSAPGSFADVALCDSLMREQGVLGMDRYLGLSPRAYNGMADDLSKVSRSFGNKMSDEAYKKGDIPGVGGFDICKMDYANTLAAAAGSSLTVSTLTAAGNYWVPKATSAAVTGEESNVDNRFQTVTISSTTGVKAGDAFTIAGVQAVHHETKNVTGQLKTFRVMQVVDSTDLVITPPIVSNQGDSGAEAQYQNVEVAPSGTAAISFLNIADSYINPFWCRDAVQIRAGRIEVEADAGVGVLKYTTPQGLQLTMQKQYDIKLREYLYRVDSIFGVTMLQPEMCGILMFNQTT